MGIFDNEYENKIDEIEVRWYEFWESNDIDLSSEIEQLKVYERRISKINKIEKKYNKNVDKFTQYYNEINEMYSETVSNIDSCKRNMSTGVSYYISNFEDKIDEVNSKLETKRQEMEDDYNMINSAMVKLGERKTELVTDFNNLYEYCKSKKTG